MRIDLITQREDLASIRCGWRHLAAAEARDGFFRTPEWYEAWMRHIRPDAEPFVVVAYADTGQMVGLAPLCRLQYRDLGWRLSAVAWAGREVVSGDFLDFLISSEMPEARSAMLEFLWERRKEWGMLVLGELAAGSASEAALRDFAGRHALPIRSQEERLCPHIELPQTFDDYLGTLGSSTRYHIRRRIRDVEKRGARVQVFTQPAEVAARIDTMMELHIARWRKDGQCGTFGRPGFAAFMRDICASPPVGSSCRLYMLTLEDRPAAALLTFHFGASALYYQAGWDPESPISALSPGVVVMAASIRDAIAEGLKYYEFLRGDEVYKSRWTRTARQSVTVLIGRSAASRSYLQAGRLKDIVKQFIRRRRTRGDAIETPGVEPGRGAENEHVAV